MSREGSGGVPLRHRDPDVERGRRRIHLKPELFEAWDESVAPFLIDLAQAIRHRIIQVERGNASLLNCLETTGVEVAFYLAQSCEDLFVSDGKPDAPAGHVVRLRQRVELDPYVLRAIDFHEARRGLAVVENLRICCIVADDDLVFLGEFHHSLKVVLAHDDRRRVVRRIQEHQLRLLRHVLGNRLQVG